MAGKLSVVPPGAKAPEAEAPKTIKAAADHSERALLVALRTRIATDIDSGVPPHTLAPLSRQLRDIDREIRALDARLEEEAAEDADNDADDEAFDAEAL